MVVRLRLTLRKDRTFEADSWRSVLAAGSQVTPLVTQLVIPLMTPLALMAWTLGFWRIAAGMKWTGEFAITRGIFSHWQVWFALGIGVQFGAFLLHRLGRADSDSDGAALP